jgi:hypothetical protein
MVAAVAVVEGASMDPGSMVRTAHRGQRLPQFFVE